MKKPIAEATVSTKQRKAFVEPTPRPTVFVSVLPFQMFGEAFDRSPKVFATREAAQADCDTLNKTRQSSSQFVVREMEIHQ